MNITDKLKLLREVCEACDKKDYARAIDNYFANLKKPVSVMIVGEGKHGKTSVLNVLLGREVAKDSLILKSSCKNYYRNTEGREFVSIGTYESKHPLLIGPEDNLKELYVQNTNQRENDVCWSLKLSWPVNGETVIDTEGFLQANNGHSDAEEASIGFNGLEITENDLFDDIYTEADLIIWCVDRQYIQGTKIKYGKVACYNKPVFLVYTKADKKIEDEDSPEIKCADDLKRDMREILGDIARDCVDDFAGFAGKTTWKAEKEQFGRDLRNSIDGYLLSISGNTTSQSAADVSGKAAYQPAADISGKAACQSAVDISGEAVSQSVTNAYSVENVKAELGERLFSGLFERLNESITRQYVLRTTLLRDFIGKHKNLEESVNAVVQETGEYVKHHLGMINGRADHKFINSRYVYYDRGGQPGAKGKSFSDAREYYLGEIANDSELMEFTESSLRIRVDNIITGFFENESYISSGDREVKIPGLYETAERNFSGLSSETKLFSSFRTEIWKEEKFRLFYTNLGIQWKNLFKHMIEELIPKHMKGFCDYLEEGGITLEEYLSELVYNTYLYESLSRIQNNNVNDFNDVSSVIALPPEDAAPSYEAASASAPETASASASEAASASAPETAEASVPDHLYYVKSENRLVAVSSADIIEEPVLADYIRGLNPEEYIINEMIAKYILRLLADFSKRLEETDYRHIPYMFKPDETSFLKTGYKTYRAFTEFCNSPILRNAVNMNRKKLEEYYAKAFEKGERRAAEQWKTRCEIMLKRIRHEAAIWVNDKVKPELEKIRQAFLKDSEQFLQSAYDLNLSELNPNEYISFELYLNIMEPSDQVKLLQDTQNEQAYLDYVIKHISENDRHIPNNDACSGHRNEYHESHSDEHHEEYPAEEHKAHPAECPEAHHAECPEAYHAECPEAYHTEYHEEYHAECSEEYPAECSEEYPAGYLEEYAKQLETTVKKFRKSAADISEKYLAERRELFILRCQEKIDEAFYDAESEPEKTASNPEFVSGTFPSVLEIVLGEKAYRIIKENNPDILTLFSSKYRERHAKLKKQ